MNISAVLLLQFTVKTQISAYSGITEILQLRCRRVDKGQSIGNLKPQVLSL